MNTAPGITSIGVIMDGNRRWARENGLPTYEGHRAGLKKISELLEWTADAKIREIVLYIFSTENWNREKEEVAYLMELFEGSFDQWVKDAIQKGTRLRFIGQLDRISSKMQNKMKEAEDLTRAGEKLTLAIAFSYGGRAEIIAGVNTLLASGATEADEQTIRAAMWSHDLADPDLIIRTGGEKRLSNFLTWQSIYSELFFVDTFWPAFTREIFDGIIAEFLRRDRRHGK